ncbi:MAG: class I SAM-dependent methyltransferase [Lachnospiraceae bacterium]|nr:class I SAM-dependent methyltransferase [Lachnospiraceae bacterium]
MCWDKKLKINTRGRDDSQEDEHHYPYEPTPYSVLERLAGSGYLNRKSVLVDYGCGKGRVDFFLSHKIGCRTIGVEYDERIFQAALRNKKTYVGKGDCEFVCNSAENYKIEDADTFYFFNPFSVETLAQVLREIMKSYYQKPRKMMFFFYYPNDEYLAYLMTLDEIMFLDEIDCSDLFEGQNQWEKIIIFETFF